MLTKQLLSNLVQINQCHNASCFLLDRLKTRRRDNAVYLGLTTKISIAQRMNIVRAEANCNLAGCSGQQIFMRDGQNNRILKHFSILPDPWKIRYPLLLSLRAE